MKKILALFCSLVLCFSAISCGMGAGSTSESNSDTAQESQTDSENKTTESNSEKEEEKTSTSEQESTSTKDSESESEDSNVESESEQESTSQSESEKNSSDETQGLETVACAYSAVSAPTDKLYVFDSATDGNFNYYLIDVGYLKNVPIWSSPFHTYDGTIHSSEFLVNLSADIETSVENTVSETFSKTVSKQESKELEVGLKLNIEGILEMSSGCKRTWGTSTERTNSTTNALSVAEKKVSSVGTSYQGHLNGDYDPQGVYRLSILATCDVYAFVKTSTDNKTLKDVAYAVSAREEGSSFAWEYEKTIEDFLDRGNLNNKISLPENFLDMLPTTEEEISPYALEKTTILNNTTSKTITQDGYYGLYQGYDELNLVPYKNYNSKNLFTKDYVFCFDVCINLKEKNDGYQEVYLYDQLITTSKKLEFCDAQETYGMICGTVISHKYDSTSDNHYLTWYVSGDKIKDTMYIRYDAHGENEDTWYRNSIKIDLTITSSTLQTVFSPVYKFLPTNEVVLENNNQYTITHTGAYGLMPRDHEKIDLKNYADYMTKDYLFLFDVSIDLKETDDGYQEIFLYNKHSMNSNNSSITTINKAREYGLLAGKMLNHGKDKIEGTKNYNFAFTTTGDNIDIDLKTLYIYYDAWGEDKDTWIKENIKVSLTIVKIPEFKNCECIVGEYEREFDPNI